MLKMRSLVEIASPSAISEKVMVATRLGPKQAMKPLVAVSTRVPINARKIATGRASKSVTATIVIAPGRPKRPPRGEQRAEDDEYPELDDLDDVLRAILEAVADVGPEDAERDGTDEDGDQAVAGRRQDRDAVGREGDPERVERLLMRGGLVLAAGGHPFRGHAAGHQSERDILEDEAPPDDVARADRERRAQGEHRGQGQAIVEAGFEVERVSHQARHTGVGHDARGEDRIGR